MQENQTGSAPSPAKGLRPFLIVWSGQLVSMLGTGLSSFGLVVWLLTTTKAATPYALAFLTATLPGILFAPAAGHLADRRDRRLVMIVADSFDALVTLAVAILVFTESLRPWMVYILTFLSATSQTFQEPAWSAAVPSIVPKEKLDRANGLTSLSQALSSLIPPLLAGLLFSSIGLKGLLVIDFFTYFAALAGILLVRLPRIKPVEAPESLGHKASILGDAAFGFRYMAGIKGMLGLVLYFAFVNFCLNFAMVLLGPMVLPLGGSSGLGIVQSVFGLGALAGGLAVAVFGGPKKNRIPFLVACLGFAALGVVAAGLRPGLAWAGAGVFVMIFAIQVGSAASQKVFQTRIEAGAQGRTRAARSMLSTSLMPLAFLSAGPLVDRVVGPALLPGGILSGTWVAQVLGQGEGRGAGLLFVLSGTILFLVTLAVLASPGIRKLETDPVSPCLEPGEKSMTMPTG